MNKLLLALILIFNLNIFCAGVDDLVISPNSQESDSESIQGDAQKEEVLEILLKEAEKQEKLKEEMQAKQQAKADEGKKNNRQYFGGLKKEIIDVIYQLQHHDNRKKHADLIKKLDLVISKLIVCYYRADKELKIEINDFIEEFQDEQIKSLSAIYGEREIAQEFAKDDNDEKSRTQFISLLTLPASGLSEGEVMILNHFKNSLVPKVSTA